MDIAPALLLATLLWKIVDLLRMLRGRNWSGVLTLLAAMLAGVIVVPLAAQSELFEQFEVNGLVLTDIDGWSQVFLGLTIASFASSLVDVKQAIDGSDSASKPPLLPGG